MAHARTTVHPCEGSDAKRHQHQIIVDRLKANVNQAVEAFAPPVFSKADPRNRIFDSHGFATSKFRFALAASQAGETANFRAYLFEPEFERKNASGEPVRYRERGLGYFFDIEVTFSGSAEYGMCPFTQQVEFGSSYGNLASTLLYLPSAITLTDVYNEDAIGNLRTSTAATANEIQTIDLDSATGGTFTLTVTINGVTETTGNITFSSTTSILASNIDAALEALDVIPPSSVTVSSATSPAVTFNGGLAGREIPLMSINGAGLTGGGSNQEVTRTTAGRFVEAMLDVDLIGEPDLWMEPTAISSNGTRVIVAGKPWQK